MGLRAYSTINDNVSEIELAVAEILTDNATVMTDKEKIDLFGRIFANNPKKFKFLPGDKTVIKVISKVSRKLVDSIPPIALDQCQRNPKLAIKPQKAIERLRKGTFCVLMNN